MAEKPNQQVYPLAPSHGHPRSDAESGTLNSKELKRKKRIKCAIYIVAFIVLQTMVITAFALTVMKVKTPKARLGTTSTVTVNTVSNTSFDITLTTQVRIKNTNFGPYKYESTDVMFMYDSVLVGQGIIPKSKAGFRSTKKVGVTVNLNSKALPSSSSSNLESDLKAQVLKLNGKAKFTGKVELLFIMKKKKAIEMNCTMQINLSTKMLKDLICE